MKEDMTRQESAAAMEHRNFRLFRGTSSLSTELPDSPSKRLSSSSPNSVTEVHRGLPNFGYQSQTEMKFPWGINPVVPVRNSVLIPSARSVCIPSRGGSSACTPNARSRSLTPVRSRHPLVQNYNIPDQAERSEFVDTSDLNTGIEPLVDFIKSVYAFFTGTRETEEPVPAQSRDVETGLREGFSSIPALSKATCDNKLPPIRFPSSVEELLRNASPPFSPSLYPLPIGDPPALPDLPPPKLRNYACILLLCFIQFEFQMNSSGVSLLATRLKLKQPSLEFPERESIQLAESPHRSPVDYIRAQLESLISQTNEQERSLRRFQAELSQKHDYIDELRVKICERTSDMKLRYRAFLAWRRALTSPSTPRTTSPAVFDSVNLNDTLRNLALSLASPLRDQTNLNTSTCTVKSLNVPFQTVRSRPPHFPPQKA